MCFTWQCCYIRKACILLVFVQQRRGFATGRIKRSTLGCGAVNIDVQRKDNRCFLLFLQGLRIGCSAQKQFSTKGVAQVHRQEEIRGLPLPFHAEVSFGREGSNILSNSCLFLLVRHLFLVAMHLFLVASCQPGPSTGSISRTEGLTTAWSSLALVPCYWSRASYSAGHWRRAAGRRRMGALVSHSTRHVALGGRPAWTFLSKPTAFGAYTWP